MEESLQTQVLIVGAGPSGLMTAWRLAEAGIPCVVIEKQSAVGAHLNCAGGVDESVLDFVGMGRGGYIKQHVDTFRIYYNDESYRRRYRNWKGIVVSRTEFDRALALRAEEAGVKIMLQTRLDGLQRDEDGDFIAQVTSVFGLKTIHSRLVVGADGPKTKVGTCLGMAPRLRPDQYIVFATMDLGGLQLEETEAWHFLFRDELPNSYTWVFPHGKHAANYGVGMLPGQHHGNWLKDLLRADPLLHKILGTTTPEVRRRGGGIVPLCGPRPLDEIVTDGALLVGDAAGMIEPIFGEGIFPAVLSGAAAAETIVDALSRGKTDKATLAVYDRRWRAMPYTDGWTLEEYLNWMLSQYKPFYRLFTRKTWRWKRRWMIRRFFSD